jgi:hypothetical protein
MTDDEIKAIEKVKEVIKIDKERRIVTLYDEKPLFRDQLQIIIDLINKQQEKIEDLKTKLGIETIDNKYNQEERDEETIPKYKIREIIDNFRNVKREILNNENELGRASVTYDIVRNDYCEEMLKELLEED